MLSKIKDNIRLWVQIIWTALTNGYVNGFLEGTIYRGSTKKICVPGLNCYSCPGALGACPIGSMQAVINSRDYNISMSIIGFLMATGAFLGRFVCGWLCPFGLFQDLLHKIPFIKKIRKVPGDKILKYFKYIILLVLVILLPMTISNVAGMGDPWFCKYVCPSGTLMGGIPLVLKNPSLQKIIGNLFFWKMSILIGLTFLSMKIFRPFCRYLCPLGAIYSFFNPIAMYRLEVDEDKCIDCGKCQRTCDLDIPVYDKPNDLECIRCGNCIQACPTGAIKSTLGKQLEKQSEREIKVNKGER